MDVSVWEGPYPKIAECVENPACPVAVHFGHGRLSDSAMPLLRATRYDPFPLHMQVRVTTLVIPQSLAWLRENG